MKISKQSWRAPSRNLEKDRMTIANHRGKSDILKLDVQQNDEYDRFRPSELSVRALSWGRVCSKLCIGRSPRVGVPSCCGNSQQAPNTANISEPLTFEQVEMTQVKHTQICTLTLGSRPAIHEQTRPNLYAIDGDLLNPDCASLGGL